MVSITHCIIVAIMLICATSAVKNSAQKYHVSTIRVHYVTINHSDDNNPGSVEQFITARARDNVCICTTKNYKSMCEQGSSQKTGCNESKVAFGSKISAICIPHQRETSKSEVV